MTVIAETAALAYGIWAVAGSVASLAVAGYDACAGEPAKKPTVKKVEFLAHPYFMAGASLAALPAGVLWYRHVMRKAASTAQQQVLHMLNPQIGQDLTRHGPANTIFMKGGHSLGCYMPPQGTWQDITCIKPPYPPPEISYMPPPQLWQDTIDITSPYSLPPETWQPHIVYCGHNGEEGVSIADLAEHIGNGDIGSAVRDVAETVTGPIDNVGVDIAEHVANRDYASAVRGILHEGVESTRECMKNPNWDPDPGC